LPAETTQNFQNLQHAIAITIGKNAVDVLEVNHIFPSSDTSNVNEKTVWLAYGKIHSDLVRCCHRKPQSHPYNNMFPIHTFCYEQTSAMKEMF
jgi:hypothetical protein